MKEIEVKILEVNPFEIREKLRKLGAEKFFEGEIEMVSMDFPDGKLENEGKILRIRKAGKRVELCFKEKKENLNMKVREEIEVLTDNYERTIKIFEKIGLKKLYSGKKHRECYRLGSIKFDMDTYEGTPTYLEVEAESEKEVEEYVMKLGYSMEQTTTMTALELEEYYKDKNDKTK